MEVSFFILRAPVIQILAELYKFDRIIAECPILVNIVLV